MNYLWVTYLQSTSTNHFTLTIFVMKYLTLHTLHNICVVIICEVINVFFCLTELQFFNGCMTVRTKCGPQIFKLGNNFVHSVVVWSTQYIPKLSLFIKYST